MSSIGREQRVKLLKDAVSLVSIEEAQSSVQELSILDRLKDSLNLGEAFSNRKIINTYAFEDGYTLVTHVPPSFNGVYVAECLEVTTVPNVYEVPIGLLFEGEKENIRKKVQKKLTQQIEFCVLKQADREAIYSCVYLKDNLQVTGVVRSFLSDQGYYSTSYKHGLPRKLKLEEVLLWKAKLEAVKIRN